MKSIALPQAEPYGLLNIVMRWEPPTNPHCSNCRFATVNGSPDAPMVACAQGHGTGAKPLPLLIRGKNARGFRSARTCPDFSSMSDER